MIDEKFWQDYARVTSNPLTRYVFSERINRMEKEIIESSNFVTKDSPEFNKESRDFTVINLEGINLRENYLEKQFSILSKAPFYSKEKISQLDQDIQKIYSEKESNQEQLNYFEAMEYFDYLPQSAEFVTSNEQAALLPNGWTWQVFPDGSGHLNDPEGKEYERYEDVIDVRSDVEKQILDEIEKGIMPSSDRKQAPIVEVDSFGRSSIDTLNHSGQLER